jgi:hypothetical protein
MGTSLEMIDRTYGHLIRGSHEAMLARMNARRERLGHSEGTAEASEVVQ